MSKNILVVCQHYWPENFRITDLCEGFVDHGYNVDVLCGIPNYPSGIIYENYSYFKNRRQKHNNVRIIRAFEIPRKGNTNFMIFLNYISFLFSSLFYIPKLFFHRYDKILIYQLSPVFMGISGILLGKLKRIETTTYVLDLWPENLYSVLDIKNPFLKDFLFRISTWFYKKTDKLITISPEMAKLLEVRTRKNRQKITSIYQYCEKLYEKKMTNPDLNRRFKNYFTIVFTGNITPAQSPETIIKTAILLKENDYEDKIHFVIVGGGMSIESFKSEIKKKKLNNMFDFEGIKPVESMPEYYNIADALLATLNKSDLLSLTIPAKITSYIAAGKPILASIDGSSKILLEKIGCGLISKPENYIDLYNNIIKLKNTSILKRKKMGKNALNYHFKHLERNKSIEKILKFMSTS